MPLAISGSGSPRSRAGIWSPALAFELGLNGLDDAHAQSTASQRAAAVVVYENGMDASRWPMVMDPLS